jgi:hypothetical protein
MYDHLRCNVDHPGMMTDNYEYNVLNLGHDAWPSWAQCPTILGTMLDHLGYKVWASLTRCQTNFGTMSDHLGLNIWLFGHNPWSSRAQCLTILIAMPTILGTMSDRHGHDVLPSWAWRLQSGAQCITILGAMSTISLMSDYCEYNVI